MKRLVKRTVMLKKAKQVYSFIDRLVAMKHEAGTLGLFRTMHALEEPQKVVGYEVADILQEKQTQFVPANKSGITLINGLMIIALILIFAGIIQTIVIAIQHHQ